MVLAELGGKLRSSLSRLTSSRGAISSEDLDALLLDLSRALIESDVSVKLVGEMRKAIKDRVGRYVKEAEETGAGGGGGPAAPGGGLSAAAVNRLVQKAISDELASVLAGGSSSSGSGKSQSGGGKAYKMKRGRSNVILFVGLQGAGKTTTIAKVAAYYQRRGWKTSMVCADTFRAGAFDQLKQNCTKLRIPFYGSYTEADPVKIAADGVDQFADEGFEVILVDTSGRHRQESALFEEMTEISAAVRPDNTVFVMDATQGQAVYDQALAFHGAVDVGSVIVTKLDGHAKGGGALSAVSATGSPILFLGTGERFDDLEPFHAQSFVSKLLGYGDVRGLVEEMKNVTDSKSQEELMAKLSRGQSFSLRDLYNQFQNVLKMGSMKNVMGMIPGMPDYLIPQGGGDDESTKRLKKFMYMMDSMTNAELDGLVDLATWREGDAKSKSRIERIAAGSGTHPMEVKMLLQCHQQFATVAQKMGKLSGMGGAGGVSAEKQKQAMAQMRRNPGLLQQRINQMDPQLLQQMGGREGVMRAMQSMSQGGGGVGLPGMMGGPSGGDMPDMNAIAQMMGGLGGGGGGGPGMPGGLGGGGGGMPDMAKMMQMMQGMGMGGMPNMGGNGRR